MQRKFGNCQYLNPKSETWELMKIKCDMLARDCVSGCSYHYHDSWHTAKKQDTSFSASIKKNLPVPSGAHLLNGLANFLFAAIVQCLSLEVNQFSWKMPRFQFRGPRYVLNASKHVLRMSWDPLAQVLPYWFDSWKFCLIGSCAKSWFACHHTASSLFQPTSQHCDAMRQTSNLAKQA